MKNTNLGNTDIMISKLGIGCMGLSEFYGEPIDEKEGCHLIHKALELGVNFFDTADMYGNGHNEQLLASALKGRRNEAVIATKFGIVRKGNEYDRSVCGKAEYVRSACHKSLRNLNTDYIDLYYIHRVDTSTPVEETIEEMARLVSEGKVKGIGMCEASSHTIRKAHAISPLSAVQSEYSMLTRDPEEDILPLTKELGITFVSYSPICRGLLSAGTVKDNDPKDVRNMFPRFQGDSYKSNKQIVGRLAQIAAGKGCSIAQLSLAWVMAQADHLVPIPGTTRLKNLEANVDAAQVELSPHDLTAIMEVLNTSSVQGERYTAQGMKGVNA